MSTPTAGSSATEAADLREQARLEAVRSLQLLDRPVGHDIDELVRLAAEVCDVPNAMLNIFDEKWQHSIASVGFEPPPVPCSDATCLPVVESGQEIIAADARLEPRFRDLPYVNGSLGNLRFYASVPLTTGTGETVGSLCAYDLEVHLISATQVSLLRSLAGQVMAIYELRRAVAEIARTAERLAEEANDAAEVLRTSMDAYVRLSPAGVVMNWNRAAEQLYGYSAEEAVGRDLAGLVIPRRFAERFRAGLQGHDLEGNDVHVVVRCKDGSELTVELRIWPSGSAPGWHSFARDITGMIVAQRERAEAEERWRVAFESAPVGIVLNDLTVLSRPVLASCNHQFCAMLGYSVDEVRQLGTAALTHPDDRERDRDAAFALLSGTLDVYRADKRYLHADGQVVWGRLTASIARTGDGVYMISQVEDITSARADERARQRAENLLAIAFEQAPHGTAIIGVRGEERGRLLRVNPALVAMTRRQDLLGSQFTALLDDADVLADFEELADGGQDVFEKVYRLRAGGGHIVAQASITLSRDAEGQPEHALAQLRDITQQHAHEEWLTRHAKTDALTGLANRLAMRERLVLEIDALRAGEGALAVLMLDLDRFKNVNDTLGHEAGDELLRRIADVLVHTVPADAMAARLGGDEFVVIAPRQSRPGVGALVDRITAAVNEVGAQMSDRIKGCVTGSVGLTMTENPSTAPEDLIRAADQAMYRTKRTRPGLQTPV